MSNVIDIKSKLNSDTLYYIQDYHEKFVGVGNKGIDFQNGGLPDTVFLSLGGNKHSPLVTKLEFNDLCIAWLLLNNPDVIKEDELSKNT